MSVMEMSHRSKEYDALHNKAILIKGNTESYEVLFIQGSSLQFLWSP